MQSPVALSKSVPDGQIGSFSETHFLPLSFSPVPHFGSSGEIHSLPSRIISPSHLGFPVTHAVPLYMADGSVHTGGWGEIQLPLSGKNPGEHSSTPSPMHWPLINILLSRQTGSLSVRQCWPCKYPVEQVGLPVTQTSPIRRPVWHLGFSVVMQ